ncbi:MAG: hypothetical protein HYV18_05665 [Gammaproteobacteria bacterium]|nr:hypothetical protein [Gammaproteobacteria bacterium]
MTIRPITKWTRATVLFILVALVAIMVVAERHRFPTVGVKEFVSIYDPAARQLFLAKAAAAKISVSVNGDQITFSMSDSRTVHDIFERALREAPLALRVIDTEAFDRFKQMLSGANIEYQIIEGSPPGTVYVEKAKYNRAVEVLRNATSPRSSD